MLHKILLATSNKGKFREMMETLGKLPVQFLSLDDLHILGDCHEHGATFEENALIKAHYYAEKSGLPTIAEDSGILIDALKGELGVKTRRWGAGEKATDEEWIEHFLNVMVKVPAEKRTASFVCCAAFLDNKGGAWTFEGRTDGVITQTLEAPIYQGLPLSSCFKPNGYSKVYSALSVEEKNAISHRGKAMKQVHDFLLKLSL